MRILNRLAQLTVLIAAVTTLARLGARWSWLCDLTVHWPVQLAAASAMAGWVLWLTAERKAIWTAVATALVVLNAPCFMPFWLPAPRATIQGQPWHAMAVNVLSSNQDVHPLLQFLREEHPDFVVLTEIDERWRRALEALRNDYPHAIVHPRPDNFGIALLSRHPIVSQRIERLNSLGLPTIVATLNRDGQVLNVIGTHALPPIGRRRSNLRNQHLRALGTLASQVTSQLIVLGDLNTTSWSPGFQQVLTTGKLRDSRLGFGLQPTWPSRWWFLRIPIDHALISRDLGVIDRRVGPDVGSDHLPIIIEFGLGA